MNEFTQRDNNRNQSTADISHKHIFLFDNKYSEGVFNNNTGGDYDLVPGTVVIRDTGDPTRVIPAIAGATLVNIVGVISTNETISGIATGTDVNVSYCHGGMVDQDLLILPGGVTLDTIPTSSSKTVGDILRALGFDLKSSTEHTKFDN
ncbi:hypothetical protein [Flagellimonas nanhaiensis]|uniref:Head decoration protein n=1 Tax=Flagellimonas nanhaiensis TaxID=2292706 RepID=A0A371JL85_9FLAO|nr:hypothetical protein [Allomuricauda nanhaiensis]RDY57706.1 hypothetical protein DX873_17550 [Allomuricauda nanhaiensis]